MSLFKTLAAVFLTASSVLAAPLESRAEVSFKPSAIWRYNVGNGAISATNTGDVAKAPTNGGQDTTALLTFTYPSYVSGQKCQFAFSLDSTATLQGSAKLDLFSSLQPAPGPTAGWGPGNQRNVNLGRLNLFKPGQATWEATYSSYLTQKTDCKAPGTVEAFELVGVYDRDLVSWNPALAGPRIVVTPS
ncbi:unnamed protein product [Clonostachys byssicola]|uniref:Ubiquitin 3 binding protein But2 C-terminal domain-containing protein n=1 Tax=Clonostachys byssicola TaxID=160290 RepID=A0A9N9U698_9HYPO|nr:unnamed protein product [Clonostachys byssicola]